MLVTRPPRRFLPDTFQLHAQADIQPYYDDLLTRPLPNASALRNWFIDRSELESYLSENFAWRYIRMTCDTANSRLIDEFNFFIESIQPLMSTAGNKLDQKALASPFLDELSHPAERIMLRGMRQANAIFRPENVPLQTEIQTAERQYGAVVGSMAVTIETDGIREEVTLQKAGDLLQSTDRSVRENTWFLIQNRRFKDHEELDTLFDKLVLLRHQVALNAGFTNFRDYAFAELGRFDYTPADCLAFHEAVAQTVVPLVNELAAERQQLLRNQEPDLHSLRPWDCKVDPHGHQPLVPFATPADLLDKTIRCFDQLDPGGELGRYLRIMRRLNYVDLDSRKGKSPGGYNYPLEEIGVPFIFMNATSSLRDLVTMVHEAGHAVHSFLTRELPLKAYRTPPMEVAELASMAMELLASDHWGVFFDNPDELRRARLAHLESIIETLPWVATIDKFQHWLYQNVPDYATAKTAAERRAAWVRIYDEFTDSLTDWTHLEHHKEYIWQKQLHLYEVPFYYIEYGIAQLGAIAVWRNYRLDPVKGLADYKAALRLGYQAPIQEIYAAANISFSFSKEHIGELIDFIQQEIIELKNQSVGSVA